MNQEKQTQNGKQSWGELEQWGRGKLSFLTFADLATSAIFYGIYYLNNVKMLVSIATERQIKK